MHSVCADYKSITIYTPNNSPVSVDQWVSGDWDISAKNDLKSYWETQYPGIIFEAEATIKYNCHAYA